MHRKTEQNRKFVATVENLTYPHFQSIESYWRLYKPPGVYFPKYGPFWELFEILDFARLTPELAASQGTIDRPKKLLRVTKHVNLSTI